jgi:hypothetical protein
MIPCSSLEQGIRVIEQGIHLSKHGILQFRLAHLAIEYRWLCFHQDEATGADQLGRSTVRKAIGFSALEKSFISYHNSPIFASKLSRSR